MKSNIEELRKKYMDNPPEGMTSKDIRNMSAVSYTHLFKMLSTASSGFIPFNAFRIV